MSQYANSTRRIIHAGRVRKALGCKGETPLTLSRRMAAASSLLPPFFHLGFGLCTVMPYSRVTPVMNSSAWSWMHLSKSHQAHHLQDHCLPDGNPIRLSVPRSLLADRRLEVRVECLGILAVCFELVINRKSKLGMPHQRKTRHIEIINGQFHSTVNVFPGSRTCLCDVAYFFAASPTGKRPAT